jgi:predicted DNA binding protein
LDQLEQLDRAGGIDPASPAFAMIAHDLGVSPAQLADALRAAKQSVAA